MRAKDLFIFVAGVAIGAVGAWRVLENKYAMIAQDEIDSVKEAFSKKEEKESEEELNEEIAKQRAKASKEKPSITEYTAKIADMGYTDYSAISSNKEEEESEIMDKPYVISPDEYDEFDDYDTIELTYYSDQVLADENDELVDDVESVVGFDSLNHFGEYEDDSVFVRNDRLKCDYQILLDSRKYSDVIKTMPRYSMED